MQIFTLPKLARALGVGYSVVYSLRQRGYLEPTQVNGSQEYYTLDDYKAAAEQSIREWKEKRQQLYQNKPKPQSSERIDYNAIFKKP